MNIDFHYGVIYIVARLAGLPVADATTVAHACQYIDDSTNKGILEFAGGESYERFATAHGMLDYKNEQTLEDRRVWAPFHFLPACEGSTLEEKYVCRPDSAVARAMVKHALQSRQQDNALHRLGITLHVYVDTWAHQNFSGTISAGNVVKSLKSDDCTAEQWKAKLLGYLNTAKDEVITDLADHLSKLGHGAAIHFPDLPWAKWEYDDGTGRHIVRDNLPDFIAAADMAHRVIRGFQSKVADFTQENGLADDVKTALRSLLDSSRSHNEVERSDLLCQQVAQGAIPGLREQVPRYIAKGEGSWKHLATGITDVSGDGDGKPAWSEAFETSDYRKFHDAVKTHRFIVTQEILPGFGLRLA